MTVAKKAPSRFAWGVGLWLAVAFGFVVIVVLAALYDRFPADERIAHAIQDVDVPAFGGFLEFVNLLGDAWLAIPLTFAMAALLVVSRSQVEGVLVLLTFLPRLLNGLLKTLVERPRPSSDLIDVTDMASGSGFPSGHTVGTAAFYGLLFFLIPVVVPWRPLRWALQAGCLLVVLAGGPARVYVGVHWPSDVLGGYLVALLFLIPALAAFQFTRRYARLDS